MIPVAMIVGLSGGWRRLRTTRPMTNLARGGISLVTSILVIWSFKLLPLAEALAIIFINPLIVTALSAPTLGERVTWRQWGAVAVGFVGALLIIRPSGGAPLDWSVLVPIGAAVLGAARDLMTRHLGASDHPSTVLFYTMVVMFLGSAVLVGWSGTHAPSSAEWWLILAAAVLVTGAYWTQIIGFKLAAAAVIAPYKYLSLVWAGLLGWAIWGDVMEPVKAAGCLLVVASGIYLLRGETSKA
jgi:drug/metabolite transporter (DMT)-like permease